MSGLVLAAVGSRCSASGQVLGGQVTTPQVEVLRVVQAAEQPLNVIVPATSVTYEQEQAFVQVIEDQKVMRVPVQTQNWHWPYMRITGGLADADLVVVTGEVQVGEIVSYRLVNPEAGQSGEIR